MAFTILRDLERRAKQPQTPKLLHKILKGKHSKLQTGIALPPGNVGLDVDLHALQQVALKIGQCLFYRDHERYMSKGNCKDIRLCAQESDVPEMYMLSWELSQKNVADLLPCQLGGTIVLAAENEGKAESACDKIFSYRAAYIKSEQLHLYTLMFWEAFAFCMAFEEPDNSRSEFNANL